MRPLVIATAGHVHHGKSSFIASLTGQATNNRIDEIRRGLTLDLGFIHTPDLSFIDCPGHDSLVKHLIAGHRAIDGACLIIALNEGIQEQTLEHIRILKWLGIKKVLVVLTKSDLIAPLEINSRGQLILDSLKPYLNNNIQTSTLFFSKNSKNLDHMKTLVSFFNPLEKDINENVKQPRLFIDRAFSLKGVGTVVAGTWCFGKVKKGDKGYLFIPGKTQIKEIRVKSLKNNTQNFEEYESLGRLALAIDGASPAEIKRGSLLVFSNSEPQLNSKFLISLEGEKLTQKNFSTIVQVGTLSLESKLSLQKNLYWKLTLPFAAPLQKEDSVIVRLPHRIKGYGHCIAGGKIIDAFKKEDRGNIKKIISTPKNKDVEKPLNLELAKEIHRLKWQAQVSEEQWVQAQILCKNQKAIFIKDDLFLSPENHMELLNWLRLHFSKKSYLTIGDAREFFKTGRKNFIKLLEYSDRNHWTFRKGEARAPFKL